VIFTAEGSHVIIAGALDVGSPVTDDTIVRMTDLGGTVDPTITPWSGTPILLEPITITPRVDS
jgi:hypothetical protein